jgi:hypothetical protein
LSDLLGQPILLELSSDGPVPLEVGQVVQPAKRVLRDIPCVAEHQQHVRPIVGEVLKDGIVQVAFRRAHLLPAVKPDRGRRVQLVLIGSLDDPEVRKP